MAKIGVQIRIQIYERDGGCLVCGCTDDLTIDHILPLSKGGGNSGDNYQTLCKKCNSEKGDKIIDYRKKKEPIHLTIVKSTFVLYYGAKYVLHGFLSKELAYVDIKLPIGTPVYHNIYEGLVVICLAGTKKVAFKKDALIGYIGNREELPKKEVKPDLKAPFIPKDNFLESYNKEPQIDFHYQ